MHHPTFVILRELSRPRHQIAIIGLIVALFVFMVGAETFLGVSGLVLLLAFGFHLLLARLSMPKVTYNTKLLILRVFGVNENAIFTFG